MKKILTTVMIYSAATFLAIVATIGNILERIGVSMWRWSDDQVERLRSFIQRHG